tara:strand:- start:917 stop:1549 length:633 start_codon:yes stop_codon:yes gene_type:complete
MKTQTRRFNALDARVSTQRGWDEELEEPVERKMERGPSCGNPQLNLFGSEEGGCLFQKLEMEIRELEKYKALPSREAETLIRIGGILQMHKVLTLIRKIGSEHFGWERSFAPRPFYLDRNRCTGPEWYHWTMQKCLLVWTWCDPAEELEALTSRYEEGSEEEKERLMLIEAYRIAWLDAFWFAIQRVRAFKEKAHGRTQAKDDGARRNEH